MNFLVSLISLSLLCFYFINCDYDYEKEEKDFSVKRLAEKCNGVKNPTKPDECNIYSDSPFHKCCFFGATTDEEEDGEEPIYFKTFCGFVRSHLIDDMKETIQEIIDDDTDITNVKESRVVISCEMGIEYLNKKFSVILLLIVLGLLI
ncbi:MAG: hypothetical protein MJ252_08035 [archaeon]|nr:hypothetical protein [archaeon]